MDDNEQIIIEFLTEASESLDHFDQDLIRLEEDPHNSSVINKIFRAIHTLKGTCGFLGFSKLESLSHIGENLLDGLRTGRLELTAAAAPASW